MTRDELLLDLVVADARIIFRVSGGVLTSTQLSVPDGAKLSKRDRLRAFSLARQRLPRCKCGRWPKLLRGGVLRCNHRGQK